MDQFYFRISSDLPIMWVGIIDELCQKIQNRVDREKLEQVVCEQVKEKFGGLRFYFHGGDDECENFVDEAEDKCWTVCVECGTKENLGTTEGYILRMCESCFNKSNLRSWNKDK